MMDRKFYQLVITLMTCACLIPVTAAAASSSTRAYDQVASKRSVASSRSTPSKNSRLTRQTRNRGTKQVNAPSRAYKPTPRRSVTSQTNRKPTRAVSRKPIRQNKPIRQSKPIRQNRPTRQNKPVATRPSRAASTYSPPTASFGYRPQTNAYKPQTNGYQPQANPYKQPVTASSRLRNFPQNNNFNNGSSNQIIRKPSISNSSRRNIRSHNQRNNRPLYFNRPWHLTYFDRYNPNSYTNWFNNNLGYRFAIERSYSAWLNACLLYTSPSPRDQRGSRMPSSA